MKSASDIRVFSTQLSTKGYTSLTSFDRLYSADLGLSEMGFLFCLQVLHHTGRTRKSSGTCCRARQPRTQDLAIPGEGLVLVDERLYFYFR